ncbi:AAA family ATPase [Kitasatospora sp. NPDC058397]|uniref:AAA family ATPase n=1 Tax=unclassified Kitasatospora TaxID=2633591 RepID=UPI00366535B5
MLKSLGLPDKALVALVGCAASGKTTASAMFPRSWVLRSDQVREDVADDAGDQSADPHVWHLLFERLKARLALGLPAVVDATSADPDDRAWLLAHARRYKAPAVALVFDDVPLAEALTRNGRRPENRRVPADVLARQHAQIAAADLAAEGFTVVHAADLPAVTLILRRLAEQRGAQTDPIEVVFGSAAARLITWDTPSRDPEYDTATLAAGREELLLRHVADGDPYDQRFEARVTCGTEGCAGPAWTPVYSLGQLAAAHAGHAENEALCSVCDRFED